MKERLKLFGLSALVLVLALCGCGKASHSESGRGSESRSDSKASFQSKFKPAAGETNSHFWGDFKESRVPSKEKPQEADKRREVLDKQQEARRSAKQISDQQEQARQAIEKSTTLIQGVYDEYHNRFLKAQAAVAEAERKVQSAMPEEMKTGTMPVPPQVVEKFKNLQYGLNECRAADSKLQKRVNELLEKAREADKLTAQDKETTEKLCQLANEIASEYAALDGGGAEKWLKDARSKVSGLEKRADTYSREAVEKIENVIRERAEEDAKKAAAEKAAVEKAAVEKAAAEERHKELVAKEQAKAQETFDGLLDEIRGLKWERCTSRLTRRREQMKTREGEAAVDSMLKKIAFMEGVHKHFIKQAKDFRFKGRRGTLLATVTDVDDKALTIQKMKYERGNYVPDKKVTRVTWEDFYALKDQEGKYIDFKGQFLGYMDQFIRELVIEGCERYNAKLSIRERSDHMLGVALTLKLFLGDKPGVDKLIPDLVKEAVTEKNENEKRKGFGPNRKWAAQWFPDVELPEADDVEE